MLLSRCCRKWCERWQCATQTHRGLTPSWSTGRSMVQSQEMPQCVTSLLEATSYGHPMVQHRGMDSPREHKCVAACSLAMFMREINEDMAINLVCMCCATCCIHACSWCTHVCSWTNVFCLLWHVFEENFMWLAIDSTWQEWEFTIHFPIKHDSYSAKSCYGITVAYFDQWGCV